MTAAYGYATQLGIDNDVNNPVTQRQDFLNESLVMDEQVMDLNGLRGRRERDQERVRAGIQRIGGRISMQPTSLEMCQILTYPLGTVAKAGNVYTYTLADSLILATIQIDRVAKVFTYPHCAFNEVVFKAAQGGPLGVDFDIVGTTESVADSGSFPAVNLDLTTKPFIFTDVSGNISINDVNVNARDLSLTIQNDIDKDRFFNNLNLVTANNPRDRHVLLEFSLPFGDYHALYNAGAIQSGGVGVAVQFAEAAGNSLLTFNIPAFIFPRRTPNIQGREEEMISIKGECFATGGGSALQIVCDQTP